MKRTKAQRKTDKRLKLNTKRLFKSALGKYLSKVDLVEDFLAHRNEVYIDDEIIFVNDQAQGE